MNPKDDLKLAGVVHDLNNVFQTLVDSADMLSEDPRWANVSAAILRCVERGKKIAEDLHNGHESGTPFEQILAHAIAFVDDTRISVRGPAIRFVCDVEPGIELISHAWERVLINLFLNSQRAMPEGGSIHVHARRPDGGSIEIVVADEGCGFPEELLDRLFEPYVSGNASTGLGLHIVSTLVKEHRGTIRAANRSTGKGAEVVITLPSAS